MLMSIEVKHTLTQCGYHYCCTTGACYHCYMLYVDAGVLAVQDLKCLVLLPY